MKKIFFLCAFFAAIVSNAQVKFVSGDWNELLKSAKEQKKYVYIDAYTDWCGWCKVLDKTTFSDSTVGNFMNSNFISAKMDMEKDEWGKKIALKYDVNLFPTGLVFNSDGKLVYLILGYSAPKDFMKSLGKSVTKENQLDLKGFGNGFDITYPDFYLKAMAGNGKRTFPTDKVVNDYLVGQNDKYSEPAWVVWKSFGQQLDNKNKKFFLTNNKKFKKLFGNEAVEDVISGFVYKMVEGASVSKDQKAFDRAMKMVDEYISDPEKTKTFYRSTYYKKTGNWKAYAHNVETQMKQDPDMSGDAINEIAWGIYKDCDDSVVISDAANWMSEVVKKEPEYNSMDTYAALLYKAKKYDEAKTIALRAIGIGKAKNIDVKSTETLMEKIKKAK